MIYPIFLSIKVSIIATVINFIIAISLARFFLIKNFSGKEILETFFCLPLVLPPTVTGFILLVLIGRNGPIGFLIKKIFNGQLLFTWWAAVIASSIVAFPLMYKSAKAAFESVDIKQERAARILGANEFRVLCTVTMPLAWPGILSGIVLSFARAIGEFGATLMIAGNIPGKTQTMPIAIYFAAEGGDYKTAGYFVIVILLLSFGLIYYINWISKKKILHYTEKERK
ncbi:molybdate ABC transporter permease subunit [Aceticella autotrophica]|uniref:Molybdenum transport system permease n=1 Tax=Aceticella autotrophica TaxID=2755338 RepID=A0A975GA15_9THEO|nr:molybdate ABC transporter permease subunit [Aceticella autotrophica]QSZ26875.1 molybdate ABC transporter permease subunit [Aceticella autotrophica]